MILIRSMMIKAPIGKEITSNITNPMYFAPAASVTFGADRTGSSSVNQLCTELRETVTFSANKTKILAIEMGIIT